MVKEKNKILQRICLMTCIVCCIALSFANAYAIPCLTNNATACLISSGAEGMKRIMWLLLVLLVVKVFCASGESMTSYLRKKIELEIGASIVRCVFSKIIRSKPDSLNGEDREGVVRRILRDAETLAVWKAALWLELPLALISVALAVFTMFFGGWSFPTLDIVAQRGCPTLAVIVLVLSPTHFLFLFWNRHFAREEQRQAKASESQYATGVEMIHGIVDLRATNAFDFADQRMNESTRQSVQTQCCVHGWMAFLQGVDNSVAGVAEVVFMAVAAKMIFALDFGFGYADYVGFISLQMAFHGALARFVNMTFSWMRVCPARMRIRTLERIPQLIDNEYKNISQRDLLSPFVCADHMTIRSMDGTCIIDDANLSIRSGEHVALVGPSGCGKSTLLKVMARQQAVTEGKLLVFGRQADGIPFSDYASQIALVSQRPFLFNGTVDENIILGRVVEDGENRLCKIADGIGLPRVALSRTIGSGGCGLSGGQIAKVALARAIFGNPQVLLLDEVTAALDDKSEKQVLDYIATKCRNITVLLVTHRHSSMKSMDRVIRFKM